MGRLGRLLGAGGTVGDLIEKLKQFELLEPGVGSSGSPLPISCSLDPGANIRTSVGIANTFPAAIGSAPRL
jgi:hypothetical protein